ncbi:MAG: hypothetical protein H7Z17_17400 [Fuerstia sp.]|nr:hypothetical protein [Fuerstiella sp.]
MRAIVPQSRLASALLMGHTLFQSGETPFADPSPPAVPKQQSASHRPTAPEAQLFCAEQDCGDPVADAYLAATSVNSCAAVADAMKTSYA